MTVLSCAIASTTEEPDAPDADQSTARPGLCGGRRVTGVPTARQTSPLYPLDEARVAGYVVKFRCIQFLDAGSVLAAQVVRDHIPDRRTR